MISSTTCRVNRVQQAAFLTICTILAAGRAPAADADKPAASQPGEISVGDPISLPAPTQPAAGNPAADAAVNANAAGNPQPAVPATGPRADVPGNGWLGLTAEESKVPGRWVVADVAADGPAAAAGTRSGDELRAINGTTLSNAEELAQSLTSFAAGQDVRLAIGRGSEVVDMVVRATPRPSAAPKPNWQAATAPQPPASAAATGAVAPAQTAPATVLAAAPPASLGGAAAPLSAPPEASRSAVVDAPPPLPGPTGSRWKTPDFTPAPTAAEPSRIAVDPPAARLPAPAGPESAGIAAGTAAVAATAGPQNAGPQSADQRAGNGRPALGVRTLPIDAGMQARFRLTQPTGAYVLGVVQDLPASRAGVPPGSVIVALGDQPVRNPADLTKLVAGGPVGRPVSLEYVLPGGEERRADVVLQPLELPLERALVGPEPTAVPTLQRAERPVSAAAAPDPAVDADAVRQEVRFLRQRLERLEQWLERRPAGGSGLR